MLDMDGDRDWLDDDSLTKEQIIERMDREGWQPVRVVAFRQATGTTTERTRVGAGEHRGDLQSSGSISVGA